MFFSPVDIRSPLGLTHRPHHDWLALSLPDPSSSSHVYNLWQNASSDLSSYALHHLSSSPSDPLRRSFPNIAYQDDRTSNSRLVPMLPYSTTTNDTFSRRTFPTSPSPQHIPTSSSSLDERSSRSLIFDPIYSSPSYTLSAAISSAPASATTTATTSPASAPLLPLPLPPPPPSSCSPHTSPSSSPPSSPECHHLPPPSLPSVHAFRLDTLQSVDPSDDPCPLSLHDLMIPSEEQEYQGHSYHFSLQSVTASNPKPQSFSDEKLPHEESALPKRKGKSKMHTCTLCQKSFPRPSGLRTHMNSHSGDKPYKCPVTSCAKSFTVRSNAKRHIRTHGVHLAQAAEAASLFGADSSLGPTDKETQRALRIRWVGQNPDERPEDHSGGQPSTPQGNTCVGDLRHDSNVDDDNFRTSRLENGCNRGTLPERRPCTSVGTLGSDARSRKHPQKLSQCSSVLVKEFV